MVDLLLADRTSAPPELAPAFSERLLLLPPSHHPFPHRHSFGAAPPADALTRAEIGLPARGSGAVVVGCFNRLKKLDRRTWAAWLALLASERGTVLWLSRLALSPQAEARLRAQAEEAGIERERVVISAPFPSKSHLATKAMADLLLDTPRYNGHLSAGDALWAALPMLVLPDQTLASRLSASLASASRGVFVARSPDDYLALSLALVRAPAVRERARAALEEERAEGEVFDVRRWAQRLERGLRIALDLRLSHSCTTGSEAAESSSGFPMHIIVAV